MSAVHVRGLVKRYDGTTAVDGIDLAIEEGEVFALLGPNGAGKTTTVEILEGHRTRDAGEVAVLGYDPEAGGRRFRERIGIVLQEAGLERELRVAEAVATYAAFYPKPLDVAEVVGLVGLEAKAGARIKTLSGGQRRRLELALGIVGDPELIFLDEPTTGFDPSARRQAWQLVDNLRSLGRTILLTTHYMDEAQHLADRVAVIARGAIVAEGPPDTLGGRQLQAAIVAFRLPGDAALAELPSAVPGDAEVTPDEIRFETIRPTAVLHELTGWALTRGYELDNLTVDRPSLEDVYLQLTGADEEAADA